MSASLPREAYAAALAAVPSLGPARLERLLRRWSPPEAWVALRSGKAAPVWGAGESQNRVAKARPAVDGAAAKVEPDRVWARCQAAGVAVHLPGTEGYPALLAADLAPPPVLFSRGHLDVLEGRRVTIVGTRNATAAGKEVAAALGRGLAEAGVVVVSGLARGIDGWAHRGALQAAGGAPPVAVVASGLDVVYPPEHRRLWEEVAAKGLLLSEVPPGSPPHAFRFPLRNRILAALGEVVVVVESRPAGGSLHTVNEATERGVTVMAVPGSPRNPAAEGTNLLLIDGAPPVVAPIDVLLQLGLSTAGRRPGAPDTPGAPVPAGPSGSAGDDGWALELLGTGQHDLDSLVQLSGRALGDVVDAVTRLEGAGLVQRRAGWYERAARPTGTVRASGRARP